MILKQCFFDPKDSLHNCKCAKNQAHIYFRSLNMKACVRLGKLQVLTSDLTYSFYTPMVIIRRQIKRVSSPTVFS